MIYLFRIFDDDREDYLEFVDREEVVRRYQSERLPSRFDWSTMPIDKAIEGEKRTPNLSVLNAMKGRGDTNVVRVVIESEIKWFSPSSTYEIPSEYTIAIKFFTTSCIDHRLTTCHHEVFDVIRESRFRSLAQQAITSILHRVNESQCAVKLDQYLNMNLRKLKKYGVTSLQVNGSYLDLKTNISQQSVSCPFFNMFMDELLDLCINKELELVGETRIHKKEI